MKSTNAAKELNFKTKSSDYTTLVESFILLKLEPRKFRNDWQFDEIIKTEEDVNPVYVAGEPPQLYWTAVCNCYSTVSVVYRVSRPVGKAFFLSSL